MKRDKAKAINALQDAVKAGFNDSRLLREDADIELIRGTPEFERIVEQVKAKRGSE